MPSPDGLSTSLSTLHKLLLCCVYILLCEKFFIILLSCFLSTSFTFSSNHHCDHSDFIHVFWPFFPIHVNERNVQKSHIYYPFMLSATSSFQTSCSHFRITFHFSLSHHSTFHSHLNFSRYLTLFEAQSQLSFNVNQKSLQTPSFSNSSRSFIHSPRNSILILKCPQRLGLNYISSAFFMSFILLTESPFKYSSFLPFSDVDISVYGAEC